LECPTPLKHPRNGSSGDNSNNDKNSSNEEPKLSSKTREKLLNSPDKDFENQISNMLKGETITQTEIDELLKERKTKKFSGSKKNLKERLEKGDITKEQYFKDCIKVRDKF